MFGAQTISSPQRQVSLLTVSKVGGATPALEGLCAYFCTISKLGTGHYKIVLNVPRPYEQVSQISICLHALGFAHKVYATTNNLEVVVKTFDTTETAADLDFDLIAVASFARDLVS